MPAASSASISRPTGIAPARTTAGGPAAQSMIVDGRPPFVGPPSRIASQASPRDRSTSSAISGSGEAVMFSYIVGSR